jgi:hypothetical protein
MQIMDFPRKIITNHDFSSKNMKSNTAHRWILWTIVPRSSLYESRNWRRKVTIELEGSVSCAVRTKKFIRLVRGIRLQYWSKVDGMNASKRECVNAWSPAAGRRHFNGPYDDMQFRNESVAWFVAFRRRVRWSVFCQQQDSRHSRIPFYWHSCRQLYFNTAALSRVRVLWTFLCELHSSRILLIQS